MILLFQLALFALIAVSFLMVVAVPVSFASPECFAGSKGAYLYRRSFMDLSCFPSWCFKFICNLSLIENLSYW